MSFGFSFSVNADGEISQTDQEKANLKSAVQYENLKPDTKFNINGHQPKDNTDWGGSLSIMVEGIGTASMSSTFLKTTE